MSKSDDIDKFLSRFEKLRLYTDGEPNSLLEDALKDDSVSELCSQTYILYSNVVTKLRSSKFGKKEDLAPHQIEGIREYEDRWNRNVEIAMLARSKRKTHELCELLDPDDPLKEVVALGSKASDLCSEMSEGMRDDPWGWTDKVGIEVESEIKKELNEGEAISDNGMYRTAIGRFFWTIDNEGLNVAAIMRRAALLPEVMVPVHVSRNLHNQAEPVLYAQLHEAAAAFLVGSYAGCMALLRTLLEHVLSEYYGAQGPDLAALIQNARGVPGTVSKAELHKLRKRANAVLHIPSASTPLPDMTDVREQEIGIVADLKVIRDLIERAPRWAKA